MLPWRNLEQTRRPGEPMPDLPVKPGFELVQRNGQWKIEPEQSTPDRPTESQSSTGTRRRQR